MSEIILAYKCHSAFITLSNSIDGTNDNEMLVVWSPWALCTSIPCTVFVPLKHANESVISYLLDEAHLNK